MSKVFQLVSLPANSAEDGSSNYFTYLECPNTCGLVVSLEGTDVRLAKKNHRNKGQHWRYSPESGHIESAIDGFVLLGDILSCNPILAVAPTGVPGEKWSLEEDGRYKNEIQTNRWNMQMCDTFLSVMGDAVNVLGMQLCIRDKVEHDGQKWQFVEVPQDVAERKKEQAILEEAAARKKAQAEAEAKRKAEVASRADTSGSSGEAQRVQLTHPPRLRTESPESPTSSWHVLPATGNRKLISTDTLLGYTMEERAERRGSDHSRRMLARQASITRWQDLAAEPLVPAPQDDEETGLGKMPHALTLKNPDGSVKTVSLTKPGAKLCCGLPLPPGGWYGPFGFLRMVTYGFCFCGALAIICFLDSIYVREGWNIFWSVLLSLASALSAVAAWAHEGLANQVSEIAKENDRFAENGEKLHEQIDRLQGTEERITHAVGQLRGDVYQLGRVVGELNKITNLSQINTMLRGFLTAERNSGQMDLRLNGEEELHNFWSGSKIVLRKELPEFDLDAMHKMSLQTGLTFTCINLIISAVLRNSEGHSHDMVNCGGVSENTGHTAAVCHLNLVLFANEPQHNHRLQAFEASINDVIDKLPEMYQPLEKLHDVLVEMQSAAAAVARGPKVVPDEKIAPLAKAMQHIRPWAPHVLSHGSFLAVAAVADLPL